MPFGLCNAPASFQRMMNEVLKDLIGKSVMVYLDDVTIYTKTYEEHLQVLEEVFKRLRKYTLFGKPSKCSFGVDSAKILGFVVDHQGVHTDPDKVKAVATFPRPSNVTEVCAFLGLAMYYRRMIKGFANIALELNMLTRNDTSFFWGIPQWKAFKYLKYALCTAPVLTRPDFEKLFILFTDACATELGAVLTQKD